MGRKERNRGLEKGERGKRLSSSEGEEGRVERRGGRREGGERRAEEGRGERREGEGGEYTWEREW